MSNEAQNNTASKPKTMIVETSAADAPGTGPVQDPVSIGQWPGQTPDTADPFDREQGEKSLALVLDNIMNIPLDQVRRSNVLPAKLVSVGFCYDRLFQADRDLFERAVKAEVFNAADYDNMFHRSMAFWHLTICLRQAVEKRDPLEVMANEAKPVRSKLLKAAVYLWSEDPRLGDLVANIRSGQAYINQADDMGNLTRLFVENWDRAEGRCDVTKEDVVKAQELGAGFLASLSEVKTGEIPELKDRQLRAGEYLRRGIDDIRTAAAFVFRRDQERLSCYPMIRKVKRRASDKAEDEVEIIEEVVERQETQEPLSPIPASAPTANSLAH